MRPASLGLARLGLLLGSALGSLLVAELAVRAWAPVRSASSLHTLVGAVPEGFYERDPQLRHVPRAHRSFEWAGIESEATVRTNGLGLRGPELVEDPARRVLVVGDSFTFAAQVPEEETAWQLLSGRLTEELGEEVEVLNGGVDHYGCRQGVGWLERLLPEVQPDVVLYNLYLGNDLLDDAQLRARQRERPSGARPRGAAESGPSTPPEPAHAGESTSRLARLGRVSHLAAHALGFARMLRPDPSEIERLHLEVRQLVDPDLRRELLAESGEALRRLDTVCREHRTWCGVALVPPAYLVHTERLPATLRLAGMEGEAPDGADLVADVERALPPRLARLDLGPGLREVASSEQLYFTFDPHWSPAGHARVAEVLTPFLAAALEEAGSPPRSR